VSLSRREFLAAGLAAPGLAAPAGDLRELISQADLIYDKPVARSEEGIPIGTGRMGTLVWTTPTELRFQINRTDVYANDCTTNSFFERNDDYCGGCGFVEIECGATEGIRQHLSVYDGLLTLDAPAFQARLAAWPARDVIAIRVEQRHPAPVTVHLRMLRYLSQYFGGQLENFLRDHVVTVRTRSHIAASRLLIQGERILLTQEFREGGYYNKSAVAIGLAGSRAEASIPNETEVRLSAAAGVPNGTILIASAASFDPQEDVAASALRELDAAAGRGFAALAAETAGCWHDFWERGHIRMESADGVAQEVARSYHYFLYLMAASSRGKYPPKFNGMLWNTGGDLRTWGAQHWFANLSCYYEALPASNRLDLMDPAFAMYTGMYDACATAARQQWGSKGIYIPETAWFNGLAKLPDDIAAEMRELYLKRKPWEQRSERFKEYALTKHPHSSRWNWNQNGSYMDGRWTPVERGFGPYGPVTHILGSNAKIAYLYWRQYEYTLDRAWLRDRAYPMLKGAAEFYRNFPNVQKGSDGKYHIHHVNSNESVLGARDTDEDLSAMRGLFAALLRASEILGLDADMRPAWREFVENLGPIPTSDDADALKPADYHGPRVFVRGRTPAVQARGLLPDGNSLPMWFFDLCHVETRNRWMLETAHNTLNASFRNGLSPQTPVGVLSKIAIAAASLGRADAVRYLIPNQMQSLVAERGTAYRGGGVLANRMALREGPQALDAERLGRAAEALQLALLQSYPPAPAAEPILHVFPAWPKEWSAHFKLRARGAFVVEAAIQGGNVQALEIVSEAGAECVLRNPWGDVPVRLRRDGNEAETLHGTLVRFPTRRAERIAVYPA
jgi:hypothetical protein